MENYVAYIIPVRYKSLICILFLSSMIAPVDLYGMDLTPQQKGLMAEAATKEATEAEKKRLRGQKKYTEIRKEGEKAWALEKEVKIQGSDGIASFPLKIAKMSKTLTDMFNDLGNIPKDPIPLIHPYPISVINDVRNIIHQRFVFPDRIKDQIEKYSLPQLIERFSFVHYLEFPKGIKDVFKPKIVALTKNMDFQEIVKNKDVIKQLDPNEPEFKSFLAKAHAPYITIVDDEGQSLYVPENIYNMSEYLSTALNYHKDNRRIPFNDYPIDLLRNLFDGIENRDRISLGKKIENYSLEDLIENINCLEFLGFSQEIQKPFCEKIYVVCKQIPWQDLQPQLEFLNPHLIARIFGNPIIDKLKSSLLEKALTLDARKTILDIGYKVAFSPNNKMFVTGHGRNFQLYTFNSDGTTNLSQELSIKDEICTITFSSNNRKLAIGTHAFENNILLYDIDDKGIINKDPQILIGHQRSDTKYVNKVYDIAFSPNGKLMVSANSHAHSNNLLLWTLNENGTINEKSQVIVSNQNIISPIKFNDDGTMFIISRNLINTMTLSIFNENCSLESKLSIESHQNPYAIIFYHHDKKFIAASSDGNEHYFHVYDFSNENNITSHQIFHYNRYIKLFNIFNDITVIGKRSHPSEQLLCIDVNDLKYTTLMPKYEAIPTTDCWGAHFRPDGKKMILSSPHDSTYKVYHSSSQAALYTTLTDEEERLLNSLKGLDWYQILFIDKMLSGATDLPSLTDYKIPDKIIELLKNLKVIQ